jgi:hypothetical protein
MKSLSLKLFAIVFALSLAPTVFAADPSSHPRPRPPRQALWECATRNMRGEHFYGLDPIGLSQGLKAQLSPRWYRRRDSNSHILANGGF